MSTRFALHFCRLSRSIGASVEWTGPAPVSGVFEDRVDLIGDEAVGLAMNSDCHFGVLGLDKAENLVRGLIDPVPEEA
jgi:hypothetical protein